VLKDYKKAVKWYRKAAEQGSEHGQNNLGIMYIDGMGVPKDLNKAKYWIEKAYENPNANSKTKDWIERIWNDNKLWKY
jgi:TPR repeat protein